MVASGRLHRLGRDPPDLPPCCAGRHLRAAESQQALEVPGRHGPRPFFSGLGDEGAFPPAPPSAEAGVQGPEA